MAWPADTGPKVQSALRMATVRFPDCRSPAARGMKRSLPYVKRQHTVGGTGHSKTRLKRVRHFMARATPYLYTMPFGHDVVKTYGSPSVGHQTGWIEPFQNHRGVNSAAAWLD